MTRYAIIVSLLIVGCVSVEKENSTSIETEKSNKKLTYKEECDQWIGKKAVDLMNKWGEPQKIINQKIGSFFLVYREEDAGTNIRTGARVIFSSCETTFQVEDFIVKAWSYEGTCTQRKRIIHRSAD